MRVVHSLAGLALASALGSASAFTGNNLHRLMQAADHASQLAAAAYIRGHLDAAFFTRGTYRSVNGTARSAEMFCMPEGATVEQAHDIVKAHLAANPEVRHLDAGGVTLVALGMAWPCR